MRDRALGVCMVIAATLAMAGAAHAAPKSIFDDDWVPPKATETPRPAPQTAGTPSPTAVTPDSSVATTPKPRANPQTSAPAAGAVATLAVARRPVPGRSEQAPVRKLMKDVYAADL